MNIRDMNAAKMHQLGKQISQEIPGMGFVIMVFSKAQPGNAHFVNNVTNEAMVAEMQELARKLKPQLRPSLLEAITDEIKKEKGL